jgi:hypothetical protein
MFEKNKSAGEVNETEEIGCVKFVACHQSAMTLDPGDEPFDLPSLSISPEATAIVPAWSAPVAAVRREQDHAVVFDQALPEGITVVSPVGDQVFGDLLEESLLESSFKEDDFGGRSAFHVNGERKSVAVSKDHDFAALAPFGFTNAKAPLFAGANVPSTNPSVKSYPPFSFRCRAKP